MNKQKYHILLLHLDSYDFCNMVAGEFLKSEEYKNEKYSAYEMLEKWVNDNKDFIKEQHSLFIGDTLEKTKTRIR